MTDIYKMLDGIKIKLTAEEVKQKENFDKIAKEELDNLKIEEENKKLKKTSGKQKLKDLGLDDDEIKALTGA